MRTVKTKISLDKIGVSASTITIPLGTKFFPVDNTEEIEKVFVEIEKAKTINPIVDNKKIIFRPSDNNWDIIDDFKINLNFYTPISISNGSPQYHNYNNGSNGPGVYSDIGFIYDDLFCRSNKFLYSFIRLLFYDNPNSGDNKLLFSSDIYTQIGDDQKVNEKTRVILDGSASYDPDPTGRIVSYKWTYVGQRTDITITRESESISYFYARNS